MNSDNPKFVDCAMEAFEQGIQPQDIKEECSCRMGLPSAVSPLSNSSTTL